MDAVAWEVLARFRSPEAMDQAIERLKVGGFERGDLGLPEIDPPPERATAEAGSLPADSGSGTQQYRVFYSAVFGAVAAMIGALIAATQRGGMAAIGGAAVGAGLIVGIVVELIVRSRGRATQRQREQAASRGKLVLSVRTGSAERRERACTILRDAGGELL